MTKPKRAALPSGKVEPFSRDGIRKYLDEHGLVYLRDKEDDFLITFRRSENTPELRVWLMADGPQQQIYGIACFATAPPGREMADWLRVCNEWNRQKRWPKAYVSQTNDGNGMTLALESQLDLKPGIHRALFENHTTLTLAGILQFFEWLAEAKGRAASQPS